MAEKKIKVLGTKGVYNNVLMELDEVTAKKLVNKGMATLVKPEK